LGVVITIRPFTVADIPFGMELKQQAGWNQVEADWRRFLDLEPASGFVAEWAGQPAGTVLTCIFGDVAWVAMVLVQPTLRGRGIGTALMNQALACLDQRGVATVRLDATPLGRPLYEKLGFEPQFSLARYDGILAGGGRVAAVEPVLEYRLPEIIDLDRRVTGTDREKLLRRLWAEDADAMRMVCSDDRVAGYRSARPGSDALFLGPCVAAPGAGELLLADAAFQYAGRRVYVDIPVDHPAATALAERLGLVPRRHLLRMCRGKLVRERLDMLWASSGPEKG
jgi:GNAT superfamily N-acetyltransferase